MRAVSQTGSADTGWKMWGLLPKADFREKEGLDPGCNTGR